MTTTTTTTVDTSCQPCATNVLLGFEEPRSGYVTPTGTLISLKKFANDDSVTSAAACAAKCAGHPAPCLSYQWSTDAQNCRLFAATLFGSLKTFHDWHREYEFYNRLACGACRKATTRTTTVTTTTTTTVDTSCNCAVNVLLGFEEPRSGYVPPTGMGTLISLQKFANDASVTSAAACAAKCAGHPAPCLSYQWSTDAQNCRLFAATLFGALKTFHDWHREYEFYNRLACGACRKAPTTTTTTTTTT